MPIRLPPSVAGRLRLLLAALACAACVLAAPRAARATPATRVYVGVYLRDVTHFDQRNGTFDADLEMWAKWLGDFDPANLRIANEASLTREDLGTEDDAGWHVHRWRVRGTLGGEFPLHQFPFDDQTLAVSFELPERSGVLVPDLTGSGMERHFSITGWYYDPHFRPRTEHLVYRSDLGSLSAEGRPTDARRVHFEVVLRRPAVTVSLKLFLPLALILLVALLALFLPPDAIEPRSSMGVTALLACFAFQFTVAGTLPDVAYLTLADKLFILSYVVAVTALLVTVASFWLDRHARHKHATRVDLFGRVGLPLLVAIPAIVLLRKQPLPVPETATPVPAMARAASSRRVVRVGVAQLPNLLQTVVTSGTRWGLVQVAPDDAHLAVLAEREPEVGNDAVRLRADGGFEVHWRLRPGLRWSDGHALTSDDVRFAFEVSPDPEVVNVATPDARSIVVTYAHPTADGLAGIQPVPRHRLAEVFRRGGYDAVTEARRTWVLPGTGPYRVVSWAPEREAILEANPYFVGAAPAIARIEVRCIPDRAALLRAFEAGELDILAPSALTREQTDALALRQPGAVLQRPSDQLFLLQPDPAVPLLQNRAVRAALLAAIDREGLSAALSGAQGRVAHVPLPGAEPAGVAHTAFDAAGAREALAREGAAGQTVRLTSGNGPIERRTAQWVADAWTAAGMVVDRVEVASTTAFARDRNSGGMLLNAVTADRDMDPRRFWNLPREGGRFVAAARTDAFDDAVADLADRERRALFPERRAQLRERMYVLLAARLPVLPLVFTSERYVAAPALRGWDRGAGVRFGEGIEQWHFAPDAR